MNAFLKSKSSYRNLISFRKAECIYDITYYFINANLEFKDRTRDQMLEQPASGKQNIVEGREAATTSRETEIKLYNVARASLQELLQDYEDYLRTRTLAIWTNTHPRYAALLRTCRDNSDTTYYTALLPRLSPEETANMALTLIHQTDAMLNKLIKYAQDDFLADGGIREQMSKARLNVRRKS